MGRGILNVSKQQGSKLINHTGKKNLSLRRGTK
jgi:hypothetical protein